MQHAVIVIFGPGQRVDLALPAGQALPAPDEGRRWLDEQFAAHGCEPLRASGKVLIADKLLALAAEVGPAHFRDDAGWAQAFARATLGALARPVVTLDVEAGSLHY